LSSSDIVDLRYKGGVATLSINEVFPEDEGVYVCKAINSIGAAETSAKLKVFRKKHISKNLECVMNVRDLFSAMDAATAASKVGQGDKPPKIVNHLASVYSKDGEAVTLECKIIGEFTFTENSIKILNFIYKCMYMHNSSKKKH